MKILTKVLAAFLLFALCPAAAVADPGYLIDGSRFISKTYGFSIRIPTRWGAEPSKEAHVPVRFVRATGRVDALVFVGDSDAPTALPTNEEMDKFSGKRFLGFHVTSSQDKEIGGYPFREYVATGSSFTRSYKVYYGQVGSQVFVIWLSSNQEAFAEAEREFWGALKQIQFEVRDAPTKQHPTTTEG